MSVSMDEIRAAALRIKPHILRTPLVKASGLGLGDGLFVKLETLQETGSFKIRGGMNTVLSLSAEERSRGVVTASSGNHGPALACAARRLGVRCVVCLSKMVPANKVANVERHGGTVRIVGNCYDEAVEESRRLAEKEGMTFIPAFDHPPIINGAGTAGLEIVEDMPDVDTVLAPLSGGGMLAGIAIAIKELSSSTRVIGVSMERGASMHESLKAGRPVNVAEEESLADALGGNIGLDNRWTFPLVRDLVDETILVSEELIAEAMRRLLFCQGLVVEGSGAVGLAALLGGQITDPGKRVAIVASGRNIDMNRFLDLMEIGRES